MSIIDDEYLIEEMFNQSARPNTNHEEILDVVKDQLKNYFKREGKVSSECELYLTHEPTEKFIENSIELYRLYKETKYIEPDIAVYCNKNQRRLKGYIGIPQIIVEILSPSNADDDLITKKSLYEKYRVPEYWIISPMSKRFFVYELSNDKYIEVYNGDFSNIFPSRRFEGLSIDLSEVELI